MPTDNRRKKRGRRRTELLKFAYSGPFATLLDPRVGRALPRTEEPYTPTSAESYTVADAIGQQLVSELVALFGREAPQHRKARRRRGGGRRVAA